MPTYIVMYIKVRDLGDKLEFDGPFIGKQVKTKQEATIEAKSVVNDSRHTLTIPNIFEVPDDKELHTIVNLGKKYFDRLIINIKDSKEIIG